MGYNIKEDETGRVYSMYRSKSHKNQILVTDHEQMRPFHIPICRYEYMVKMSFKYKECKNGGMDSRGSGKG